MVINCWIEMELLWLICMNRMALGMGKETDVIMQAVRKRQSEIGMDVIMNMMMEGGRVNNYRNVWTSMMM